MSYCKVTFSGSGEIRALGNIAMSSEAAHEWEIALDTRKKRFNHKVGLQNCVARPVQKISPDEKEEERQTIAELLLQMGRGEEALFLLDIKTQENLRGRVNLACARAYTVGHELIKQVDSLGRWCWSDLYFITITTC